MFGLLPGGHAAPAKKGSSGPFIGPGIVLRPLKNQDGPGIASNVHSFGAEQGDPVSSQTALAPLIGSMDQFAKDIIFAVNTSPGRGTGSRGELFAHDLDMLRLDSGMVQALLQLWQAG